MVKAGVSTLAFSFLIQRRTLLFHPQLFPVQITLIFHNLFMLAAITLLPFLGVLCHYHCLDLLFR